MGTVTSGRWFDYDAARQLLSARNASTPGASTEINSYVYDSQSNRTADSNSGTASGHEYTLSKVNSIDSITNEQGQFTWTEYPSYDLAGNLTDNAEGKTFEWDAANRLTAINSGNLRSEFTYDGLSRRVKIVEKTGPTVTSTKQFVWIGNRIAQERDASNSIKKHYFADGEVRGVPGTRTAKYYYYTRDHLGSIREVTSGGGIVEVRYDYDPYGLASKIAGTLDVDFGYTGHYFHAPSSLNLTLYRAYNPTLGRWLSRDPIANAELLPEGPNLYTYVANNPPNWTDRYGQSIFDEIPLVRHIWHAIHCWRIVNEMRTECARKVPDCGTVCGATLEERAENVLNCYGTHEKRLGECLEEMNRRLLLENCAAVSL